MKNGLSKKQIEKLMELCVDYVYKHSDKWKKDSVHASLYTMVYDEEQSYITIDIAKETIQFSNPAGIIKWNMKENHTDKFKKVKESLLDLGKDNNATIVNKNIDDVLNFGKPTKKQEVFADPPKPKPLNQGKKYELTFKNNEKAIVYQSELPIMSSGFASVFRELKVGQEMYDVLTMTNFKRLE